MGIITKNVAASGDDGYGGNWGFFDNSGSGMLAGQDDPGGGSQARWSFARYTGVPIPRSSKINSCSVTFYNTSYGGPAGNVYLYGGFVAADNQAAPTTKDELFALGFTTGYVSVNDPATGTVEITGLAASFQNLVNRDGWVAGNAAVFLLTDNGSTGDRKWVIGTYDGSYAALLSVDFTPPGGEPVSVTPFMRF